MTYTQVGPADHYCTAHLFLAPGRQLVALDDNGQDITDSLNVGNRLRRVISERSLWEKIPPLEQLTPPGAAAPAI
jgi:hypothetical protein